MTSTDTPVPLQTAPPTVSRDDRILQLTRSYFEQLALLLPEMMGAAVIIHAPSKLTAEFKPIQWARPQNSRAEQGFTEIGIARQALLLAGHKTEASFEFVQMLGEMANAEAAKSAATHADGTASGSASPAAAG